MSSNTIPDKEPYQMTSNEFSKSFPFFTALQPRTKWRLYRITRKINIEETGEDISYQDFLEFANSELFRWNVEDATVLYDSDHSYYIKQALQYEQDIPSDVLAEYPELVDEYIAKKLKAQQLRLRRQASRLDGKALVAKNKSMSEEEKAYFLLYGEYI